MAQSMAIGHTRKRIRAKRERENDQCEELARHGLSKAVLPHGTASERYCHNRTASTQQCLSNAVTQHYPSTTPARRLPQYGDQRQANWRTVSHPLVELFQNGRLVILVELLITNGLSRLILVHTRFTKFQYTELTVWVANGYPQTGLHPNSPNGLRSLCLFSVYVRMMYGLRCSKFATEMALIGGYYQVPVPSTCEWQFWTISSDLWFPSLYSLVTLVFSLIFYSGLFIVAFIPVLFFGLHCGLTDCKLQSLVWPPSLTPYYGLHYNLQSGLHPVLFQSLVFDFYSSPTLVSGLQSYSGFSPSLTLAFIAVSSPTLWSSSSCSDLL